MDRAPQKEPARRQLETRAGERAGRVSDDEAWRRIRFGRKQSAAQAPMGVLCPRKWSRARPLVRPYRPS